MQLACDIIDNCRCYANTATSPQFCGARHGPKVEPCPPACCAGGCNGPEPFAILNDGMPHRTGSFWLVFVGLVILVILSTISMA
jgi:hypothetical protein